MKKIKNNKKNRNWNEKPRTYENPYLNTFIYRSFN